MTVLGFDPGSHNLGWAITTPDKLLDYGLVTSDNKVLDYRFLELYNHIVKIFDRAVELNTSLVAIEQFVSKASLATDAVKGITGILRLEATKRGIPTDIVYPSTVKKELTGKGNSDKSLVADIVRAKYMMTGDSVKADVTDAIAATVLAHRKIDRRLANMDVVKNYIETSFDGQISFTHIVKAKLTSDRTEARQLLFALSRLYVCKEDRGKYTFIKPMVPVGGMDV